LPHKPIWIGAAASGVALLAAAGWTATSGKDRIATARTTAPAPSAPTKNAQKKHNASCCVPPPPARELVALPANTLIENIGASDLPITTKSRAARKLTHQGFALMHGYWFNESVRSFRDAVKADSECPGAWIGLHIMLTFPWFATEANQPEAAYALKRAQALAGGASQTERDLIFAFATRASGKASADTDWAKGMTQAVKNAGETVDEPRLIWAGITVQTCMARGYDDQGKRIGSMQNVLALVDPVLAREPNNAAALHYRIHALESREPEKALDAARRLGKAAPGIPHLLHMPGHIFYRLGLYQDADDAFSGGRRAEEAYFARAKKAGTRNLTTTWNYGHNLAFLVLNLAETGRLRDAAEATRAGAGAYGYTMTDWRAGRFAAIAARNLGGFGSGDPYNLFFAGMAQTEKGDVNTAQKTLRALQAATANARKDASVGLTYQRTYETMALELQGVVESAQNRHDAAITTLRAAVKSQAEIAYDEPPYYIRPAQESLALACMRAGRFDDAVAASDDELKLRPHSGYALFNRAQALSKAGRTAEARDAYAAFLEAWKTADADLPQLREAKRFSSNAAP